VYVASHFGPAELLLLPTCGYGHEVLAASLGDSDCEGCSIEFRCEPARATLVVRGALDVWSLAALHAQLDQLTYTSSEQLTIDLCGISTMDSEVVRALEGFARSTEIAGRRLSIRCDPGPVVGWLYAAGLDPVV
jgi:anti-anti-sigma regulatory factor